MKIAIGNDHAGTVYKYKIIEVLEKKQIEFKIKAKKGADLLNTNQPPLES